MVATIIRGITAHTFASDKERSDFLAPLKWLPDGTLPLSVRLDKLVGAIGATLDGVLLSPPLVASIVGERVLSDAERARKEAEGKVEMIPCRNGDGYNLYTGPQGNRKFVPMSYVSHATVARIFGVADQLAAIKASGTERYYSARESYEIQKGEKRGQMQDAEPAVIVAVSPGGLATKIILEGAAADDYAKQHNMLPVNNPPKPPVSGKL